MRFFPILQPGERGLADSHEGRDLAGVRQAMQELDYTGAQGGMLAMAFAAGAVAAFSFLAVIGKFLWGVVGKAKDDQIARLEKEAEDDRKRCAAMEERLIQRIQQLEGFILAMSPGHLRQDFQRALSEQRMEDRLHAGRDI